MELQIQRVVQYSTNCVVPTDNKILSLDKNLFDVLLCAEIIMSTTNQTGCFAILASIFIKFKNKCTKRVKHAKHAKRVKRKTKDDVSEVRQKVLAAVDTTAVSLATSPACTPPVDLPNVQTNEPVVVVEVTPKTLSTPPVPRTPPTSIPAIVPVVFDLFTSGTSGTVPVAVPVAAAPLIPVAILFPPRRRMEPLIVSWRREKAARLAASAAQPIVLDGQSLLVVEQVKLKEKYELVKSNYAEVLAEMEYLGYVKRRRKSRRSLPDKALRRHKSRRSLLSLLNVGKKNAGKKNVLVEWILYNENSENQPPRSNLLK